jgi:hypothetical protein
VPVYSHQLTAVKNFKTFSDRKCNLSRAKKDGKVFYCIQTFNSASLVVPTSYLASVPNNRIVTYSLVRGSASYLSQKCLQLGTLKIVMDCYFFFLIFSFSCVLIFLGKTLTEVEVFRLSMCYIFRNN